jgi:hypothetical protein
MPKQIVDELELRLRRWGREFGPPPPSEWDEDSSHGSGGLTAALLNRMRTGVMPIGPEPFGCDRDEHGKVTRGHVLSAMGKQSEGGARTWRASPEAERVELAWEKLYYRDRTRGVCMRIEYCAGRGYRRREKLAIAARALEARITMRTYRREIDLGREFMAGALGITRRAVAA